MVPLNSMSCTNLAQLRILIKLAVLRRHAGHVCILLPNLVDSLKQDIDIFRQAGDECLDIVVPIRPRLYGEVNFWLLKRSGHDEVPPFKTLCSFLMVTHPHAVMLPRGVPGKLDAASCR